MRVTVLLSGLVFLSFGVVRAERVFLSDQQKKAEATHIITGLVRAVYAREAKTTLYGEGTLETHFLIEIEVQGVEKGEGLKKGDLVYARLLATEKAWRRRSSARAERAFRYSR